MIDEKQLEIDDLQVHYKIVNAGAAAATVIFIHGFPFDSSIWDKQMDALPEDVCGIAYDIRGFGKSLGGHSYCSIDLFASDLITLIQRLQLSRVILCGVSMGGYIALRAAQRTFDALSGLILCDTNAEADSNAGKLKRFASIEQIMGGGKALFAENFVKGLFSRQTNEHKPLLVKQIVDIIAATSNDTICAAQLALASRTETISALPAITVPALIVRGEEDQMMSIEQAEQLDSALNSGGIIEIADAGHLPNAENPEAFNEAMNTFLKRIN